GGGTGPACSARRGAPGTPASGRPCSASCGASCRSRSSLTPFLARGAGHAAHAVVQHLLPVSVHRDAERPVTVLVALDFHVVPLPALVQLVVQPQGGASHPVPDAQRHEVSHSPGSSGRWIVTPPSWPATLLAMVSFGMGRSPRWSGKRAAQ